MISKLCQSLDWEYLVYWAIPCIDSCLRAKGKLWHSRCLYFTLYLSLAGNCFLFVCVQRAGTRERAGLAVGVWLNNSGYWQARAGLLTSHIPAGDPQHRAQPLCEEGSASSPFEYILPHLVGQSFSIWPWQGHIPNGSHSTGAVQKWWRVKNQNISKLMA